MGGTLSRPVSERVWVEERPFGSAHVTEIDRAPTGVGPNVTVFVNSVPVYWSVVAGRPSCAMLTVNG